MPTNDNPQDQNEQMHEQTADVAGAKAEAALEEKALANVLAASKLEQEAAEGKQSEEPLQLAAVASEGRERLLSQLRAHAEKPKNVYVIPTPTARQLSQTELEMEAGRRANAKHVERAAPPNPNLTPSPSTPVHRPGTFVPGINSKDPAIL